jgi:pyridoxine 5-phosphate synthase
VDADAAGLERLADIGADRIELYTGPYAEAFAVDGVASAELARYAAAARAAQAAGLAVNAGHDLSQANLGAFLRAVPGGGAVWVGHARFWVAVYAGLDATVRGYLAVIAAAR